MSAPRADHWEDVYSRRDERSVSWFQQVPTRTLDIFDELRVDPSRSVADVGAGASRLVDELVQRGFGDLTIVDVSASALAKARARVGTAEGVQWVVHDVLTWTPRRTFDVWHDRAVFHFLTDPDDVQRYLDVVNGAVEVGGLVVMGTFAEDGPTHCSGLPVSRYRPEELRAVFGPAYEQLGSWREEHRTPAEVVQPFTWVAMRRRPTDPGYRSP
ncbi:MAG: trans-aconitate 2-methyltransferase [Dehalococcoidia bacterium]